MINPSIAFRAKFVQDQKNLDYSQRYVSNGAPKQLKNFNAFCDGIQQKAHKVGVPSDSISITPYHPDTEQGMLVAVKLNGPGQLSPVELTVSRSVNKLKRAAGKVIKDLQKLLESFLDTEKTLLEIQGGSKVIIEDLFHREDNYTLSNAMRHFAENPAELKQFKKDVSRIIKFLQKNDMYDELEKLRIEFYYPLPNDRNFADEITVRFIPVFKPADSRHVININYSCYEKDEIPEFLKELKKTRDNRLKEAA